MFEWKIEKIGSKRYLTLHSKDGWTPCLVENLLKKAFGWNKVNFIKI